MSLSLLETWPLPPGKMELPKLPTLREQKVQPSRVDFLPAGLSACDLVPGVDPALAERTGLYWSLVATYGWCEGSIEEHIVYFLPRCPRTA